jgi:hypothetical protein
VVWVAVRPIGSEIAQGAVGIDWKVVEPKVGFEPTTDGLRIRRNRDVSVWESLPSAPMLGAVLDEAQFARRIARDLRVAAVLGVIDTENAAIAVGFSDVSMLGIPNEYGGGMSLPFAMSGNKEVHLEPTDAWPTRALAIGAEDIAREVVARLMLRIHRR